MEWLAMKGPSCRFFQGVCAALVALVVGLVTPGSPSHAQAENRERDRAVQGAEQWAVQWVVRVKDTKTLRMALEQNSWLKEFVSSPMGQGLLLRAQSLLTTTPDEFGSGKKAWSGRLQDWLIETVVTQRPLIAAGMGHRRPSGRRSMVLAVPQLSSSEAAAAQGLLRSLTQGEWQSDQPNDLRLKGQALFGWVHQKCLILAYEAEIAKAGKSLCAQYGKPTADIDVFVDIDWLYPSLLSVRRSLLRLAPVARFSFRWLASERRFAPLATEAALLPGSSQTSRLSATPWPRSLMGAIPSETLLVTGGAVTSPSWERELDTTLLSTYLRQTATSSPPLTFALALLAPPNSAADEAKRPWPALLVRPQGTAPGVVAQRLQGAFRQSDANREVYIKAVCRELVVLTPQRAAIEQIEATCSGRRPSLNQLAKARLSFVGEPLSSFLFFDPGRTLAFHIEAGWRSRPKATLALPEDLQNARNLALQLPSLIYAGRRNGEAQQWTMNAY